ncbi:MAG: hypothetical protein EWM47_03815 [Anaerolineaceae bacterium]|nr:MAG: hypothetical protein EWM47_03815 [Anaerolineaceae bacterium]
MRRYNKNIVLILILISIFVFTGCSSIRLKIFKDTDKPNNIVEKNDDIINIDASDNKDIDDSESNLDDNSSDSDTPTPTVIQPIRNIELLIYVVNSNADLDLVSALVPADSEITPELIVNTVVDSMADQSLVIGIESVTTQDDTVIVSFYSDQPPLSNVGSGTENAILNAIAQSLTENLDDYNKVIYRVEGGPYVSGHIELGLDEIYFED